MKSTRLNSRHVAGSSRADILNNKVDMLMPARFRDQHLNYPELFIDSTNMRSIRFCLVLYDLLKHGTDSLPTRRSSDLETEDGTLVSSAIRDVTDRKLIEDKMLLSE